MKNKKLTTEEKLRTFIRKEAKKLMMEENIKLIDFAEKFLLSLLKSNGVDISKLNATDKHNLTTIWIKSTVEDAINSGSAEDAIIDDIHDSMREILENSDAFNFDDQD